MFKHVLRLEHTKTLWRWGSVTCFHLDLEGIDSSGDGAHDCLELIGDFDASQQTQSFLDDSFMQGFL